jgi:hypothetical protein
MSRDKNSDESELDMSDGPFPVDADLSLITDYLARELAPGEREAVERRLATDYDFYMKVAPMIRVWRMPVQFRERVARAVAGRSYSPVRKVFTYGDPSSPPRQVREPAPRYVAIAPQERAMPDIPEEGALPDVYPISDLERERRRRIMDFPDSFLNRHKRGVIMTLTAASLLLAFQLGTWQYVKHTATPHDVVITRKEWTPTQPTLPHGVMVETDATHTREVVLRGGSTVVVRPSSRFTYEYIAGPIPLGVMAILDGEAAINLSVGDKRMVLKTSSGGALMTTGSYAVRCETGCAAMMITVGSGIAMIRADSAKVGLSLKAGEKGMVPKGGEAEKVDPGKGWPAIEPAKP